MTDNVEIAKLRMWKAEQLATELNNWFEAEYHTFKQMIDLLRNVSIDGSAPQNWRFALTGIHRYGFKKWLEIFPNEAGAVGFNERVLRFVDEENDKEPWLIEPLRNEFEDAAEQNYIKK